MGKMTCRIDGCNKTVHAFGLCMTHYSRMRAGLPLDAPVRRKMTRYEAETKINPKHANIDELAQNIFTILRNSKTDYTIEQLSDVFDCGISKINNALERLISQGKNVNINHSRVSVPQSLSSGQEHTLIDISKFKGKTIKYGLTADNHLCSKYARLDALNALYDIWQEEGVQEVLQGGNMIDGEKESFNRFDLIVSPGIEAQMEYLANEWPYRKGIKTSFICADDHEGWYVRREGIDIVSFMQNRMREKGRDDMYFLDYMEHTFSFIGRNNPQPCRLQVIHAGGGTAYATSYNGQKIVESYQPNEKPTILLIGHYHKANYDYPRAVHTILMGTTQDQTPWMRKKHMEAHLCGWTLFFDIDEIGVAHNIRLAMHPFYDRDFYHRWKYIVKEDTNGQKRPKKV